MIYRCGRCGNYVEGKDAFCLECGTRLAYQEKEWVWAEPEWAVGDKAVAHVERYGITHSAPEKSRFMQALESPVCQCENFLFARGENQKIYKFAIGGWETGSHTPKAVRVIEPEYFRHFGVAQAGVFVISDDRICLYRENGDLYREGCLAEGSCLQYIWGTKLYYSNEKNEVVQWDIVTNEHRVVWSLKEEPYWEVLEGKIRKNGNFDVSGIECDVYGVFANENYAVVQYSVWGGRDEEDGYLESYGNSSYSCVDLKSGTQTLFWGRLTYACADDEDSFTEAAFGPFKSDNEGWGRFHLIPQYMVVGMDMAEEAVFFCETRDRDAGRTAIYSAPIKAFVFDEVEQNKRKRWDLKDAESDDWYFVGNYIIYRCYVDGGYRFKVLSDNGEVNFIKTCPNRKSEMIESVSGKWLVDYSGSVYANFSYYGYEDYHWGGREGGYYLRPIDLQPTIKEENCLEIRPEELLLSKAEVEDREWDVIISEIEEPTEASGNWQTESIAEFGKTFKTLAETTALAQERLSGIKILLPEGAGREPEITVAWDGYLKNIPKQMIEKFHADTEGRFTEYLYRNQVGKTENSSALLLVRDMDELTGRTAGESKRLWKEMSNAQYFIYQGYGHMEAISAIKHVCNCFLKYLQDEEKCPSDLSGEQIVIGYQLKS